MQESGPNRVLTGRKLLKRPYKVVCSTQTMANKYAFETRGRETENKVGCVLDHLNVFFLKTVKPQSSVHKLYIHLATKECFPHIEIDEMLSNLKTHFVV